MDSVDNEDENGKGKVDNIVNIRSVAETLSMMSKCCFFEINLDAARFKII